MKLFEKNVGRFDSLVRIVVGGSVVIYGAGLLKTPINFAAIGIGLVILATGLSGTCWLYSILGMSTGGKEAKAPVKKAKKSK